MITFDKIPGQTLPKKILLNSLNSDRLASTYLFYGPDGVGKWPMALAFTSLINCEKPVKDDSGLVIDACSECHNCRQIQNYTFPEIHFAVPIPPHKNDAEAREQYQEYLEQKKKEPYRIIASNRQMTIPIESARQIKKMTAMRPPDDLKRVIIFYQMEKMLPAAADSLLKLIEEPPARTTIILTATDPDNLLPTIQSRAQKILFKPISISEIAGYLEEKYRTPADKGSFAGRLAEGSLGQALDFISDEDETSFRQTAFLMFKSLFVKDTPAAAGTIDEFINPQNRGETGKILLHWQSFLSDLILLKFGGDKSGLINSDLAAELDNLTVFISTPENFGNILDELKKINLSLRRNVHIRPAMAALVFKIRRQLNQSA